MDWENERYARLYVRDSLTWTLWGWEARVVCVLLLRKVDRAGVFEIGAHEPAAAVAAVTGLPLDVATKGLDVLIGCGTIEKGAGVLVMPNYLEAQESVKSGAQRKREWRERRRDESRGVTPENETGHDVPPMERNGTGGGQNVPSLSPPPVPTHAVPTQPEVAVGKVSAAKPHSTGFGRQVSKAATSLWDDYEADRVKALSGDRPKQTRGYTPRRKGEVQRFVKHVMADLGCDATEATVQAGDYLHSLIAEAVADDAKVRWTTHGNVFTSAAWDRYRGRQLAGLGVNGQKQREVVDGLPLFVDEATVFARDGLDGLREYRQMQREAGTSPHPDPVGGMDRS